MEQKTCPKCKETKSVEMFSRDKNIKSGLRSACKVCCGDFRKEYGARNSARTNILIPAEKACTRCGITKSSEHFHKSLSDVSGLAGACKPCTAGAQRFLKYGLSPDDYGRMLKEQNHQCAICAVDFKDMAKGACVDHNHTTGKVRALLCHSCNASIGLLKEDVATVHAAAAYLLRHSRAA